MAERLRWWVLPGALIVLARVVTLGSGPVAPPGPAVAVDADAAAGTATIHDASGRRTGVRTQHEGSLVVELPGQAGTNCSVTLWRLSSTGREHEPCLQIESRVAEPGRFCIDGLSAGHYELMVVCGSGAERQVLHAARVEAPGSAAPQRTTTRLEPAPGR